MNKRRFEECIECEEDISDTETDTSDGAPEEEEDQLDGEKEKSPEPPQKRQRNEPVTEDPQLSLEAKRAVLRQHYIAFEERAKRLDNLIFKIKHS